MEFSTVQIRPDVTDHNNWAVDFWDLFGDRVNEGQGPTRLGFYYYPRKLGKVKAFNTLRAFLVATHEEEIVALTKSLDKLKALRMPHNSGE